MFVLKEENQKKILMNKEIILIFDEFKIQFIKMNQIHLGKLQVHDIAFVVKKDPSDEGEPKQNKIGF